MLYTGVSSVAAPGRVRAIRSRRAELIQMSVHIVDMEESCWKIRSRSNAHKSSKKLTDVIVPLAIQSTLHMPLREQHILRRRRQAQRRERKQGRRFHITQHHRYHLYPLTKGLCWIARTEIFHLRVRGCSLILRTASPEWRAHASWRLLGGHLGCLPSCLFGHGEHDLR